MSFYQQIAPYYHHIFKINEAQINFITSKIPENNAKILDVGCGIGTLSFELIKYYKSVLGVDMDAEMIQTALKNKKSNSDTIQFEQLSMLELDTSIDKNSINGIICFGNTLVHLNSIIEINDFLEQAKTALTFDGKLLLQIVNYDRIIAKNIKELPRIENDEIIFERSYRYRKPQNKIDFNTRLTVKTTQQIIENSIELLPLLKKDMALLLEKAGFKHSNFYGNFNKDPHSVESPALVVEAW
ncbi:class I SAM-dependent methyltransferase [Polaribacter sp. Z014]|uniref:class I SAM-dependent methyltransferase n=1 Tax=unclassified Polaribacter TaxID=196858 RepID=UPI00193C22C5|nr:MULTISPECIES: class I SAM-dependent methyltransferase [unclassified Polaribacter]MCL7765418.1 class I SAM-dependent methyltransferase [Polaribacter sp. Z014]QVY66324.1 class I SAM-dependent methyltransferase [Polaribacter sp. Q13]